MKNVAYGTFPFIKAPELKSKEQISQPILPSSWTCMALLHPYSPSPDSNQQTTPFFQLCIASISFIEGQILSVQVTGLEYGTWWYKITQLGTTLSIDEGSSWKSVDMGWTLPTVNWLKNDATYFKTGFLNWMEAQKTDWWKQPVENSNATTWIWFNSLNQLPFRMMFGAPPPTPTTGDPLQLAFFQNFSFTYFSQFEATSNPNITTWNPGSIQGFNNGNPFNYKMIEWNNSFSMTTLMTPVDSKSMPLPTCVLYQWKPDQDYQVYTDRTQCTIMSYEYNPNEGFGTQIAMLYGVAPSGMHNPPALAGNGYIFNEIIFLTRVYPTPFILSCSNIGLGEEPPNWASIPSVEGSIHATIVNNPSLSPNETVNIISVLFPPTKEYPQGRYLWTWYSPFPGSDGSKSRPVTFMESASNIAEGGTSLALADYFEYIENPSGTWFPAYIFNIPPICLNNKDKQKKKK